MAELLDTFDLEGAEDIEKHFHLAWLFAVSCSTVPPQIRVTQVELPVFGSIGRNVDLHKSVSVEEEVECHRFLNCRRHETQSFNVFPDILLELLQLVLTEVGCAVAFDISLYVLIL